MQAKSDEFFSERNHFRILFMKESVSDEIGGFRVLIYKLITEIITSFSLFASLRVVT